MILFNCFVVFGGNFFLNYLVFLEKEISEDYCCGINGLCDIIKLSLYKFNVFYYICFFLKNIVLLFKFFLSFLCNC